MSRVRWVALLMSMIGLIGRTAAVGIPLIALAIWLGDGLLAAVVAAAVFIACLEIAASRGAAGVGRARPWPTEMVRSDSSIEPGASSTVTAREPP